MVREQMLERLVEHPPLVNCPGEAPTLGLKRHLGFHRVLLPVTRGLPAFSRVHFIGVRPLCPFHRGQTPLSISSGADPFVHFIGVRPPCRCRLTCRPLFGTLGAEDRPTRRSDSSETNPSLR